MPEKFYRIDPRGRKQENSEVWHLSKFSKLFKKTCCMKHFRLLQVLSLYLLCENEKELKKFIIVSTNILPTLLRSTLVSHLLHILGLRGPGFKLWQGQFISNKKRITLVLHWPVNTLFLVPFLWKFCANFSLRIKMWDSVYI